MPLPAEVAYWDTVARKTFDERGTIADNSWKRPHQLHRLLRYDFMGQKVLEIGCGNCIIGGALTMIQGNHWQYVATELSPLFREHGKRMGLDIIEADVRELPATEGGFTRIIAFDALEHVRPEHRVEGYARIAQVAAPGGLLFVHFSYGVSAHDKQFDHPFGLADLVGIQDAGFTLLTYDRYECQHPAGPIDYAFVVLRR